jgi:integrase
VRRGDRREVTATLTEIDALIRHADVGMRLFVRLAWQCGLRWAEILRVCAWDYDSEHKNISVTGKGGKRFQIPAPHEVAVLIESALPVPPGEAHTGIVHLLRGKKYNGRPVASSDTIRQAWLRLKIAAAVREEIHPHDLRRTGATQIHRASGGDVLAAQQFLHHDDLATTSHYLKPHDRERMSELIRHLRLPTDVIQ